MAKAEADLALPRSNSAVHRRHDPSEGDDVTAVLVVLDGRVRVLKIP